MLMKTFKQFTEQVNNIRSLRPYQTRPSKKDSTIKILRDIITGQPPGYNPGDQSSAQLKPPTRV